MLTLFQKIIATVSILVILGSSYLIFSIVRNEQPASGPPRIPFVNGEFMLNDLEPIAAPIPADESTSSIGLATTSGEQTETATEDEATTTPPFEAVVENLTIPWDIAFLPNDHLLITERGGRVVDINLENGKNVVIDVPGISHSGEGGLLGLTLHPEFVQNNFVYLYKTEKIDGRSLNTVVRYTYTRGRFDNEEIIVSNIPGALFHNGGRIAFGPDGLLYIATGDAQDPEFSQDIANLAGKILRVTDSGEIPPENPYDNEVYSYGHRNPQGLTWDDAGALWSTEHGRSGVQSGFDELNLILPGGNYGWPKSQGNTVFTDTIGPTIHSGTSVTWAPASAAFLDGSVFFGGLRGVTLYEAVVSGVDVLELKRHFVNEFGRIRTVVVGPDGFLYMTTSNRDGRGNVNHGDDRIIRVDPSQL